MSKKVSIYLAGSISKDQEKSDGWTAAEIDTLKDQLKGFDVSFLNPALRQDDLSDNQSVFGRDMLQVFCSDVVFVDLRQRRGLGVGVEMMWDKIHHIPLLIWLPNDSHYKKSQTIVLGHAIEDFIHPFVDSLGDKLVETLAEGAQWIKEIVENRESLSVKSIEDVEKAMEHYISTQLSNDQSMQEIINANPHMQQLVSVAVSPAG